MARGSMKTLWQSRTKLSASSLLVAILILFVHIRRESVKSSSSVATKSKVDQFLQGMYSAIEAIDYMADLQRGNASIRNVVEKEDKVLEYYWFCNVGPPTMIRDVGWVENEDLFLYSAFYDKRANSLYPNNDAIQVLAMSYRQLEDVNDVYCNIHYDGQSVTVKAYIREIWQKAWDPRDPFYIPNLITCPVPVRIKDFSSYSISLSKTPCTTTENALNVRTPVKQEQKMIALCVKGMDFQEDISVRLIEWLEAQFMLGVDDVSIYTYYLSKKSAKVLEYYEKQGKVTTIPIELPGFSPNLPLVRSNYIWRNRQQKRRHEIIPYNDCLYRHLYTHRYILILDTDELIVPLNHTSLVQLLTETETNYSDLKLSSISTRNVFKFPASIPAYGVPSYMHMIKNNHRSRTTSKKGEYGKSFTSTSNTATVFNHYGLHRLSPDVSRTIYLDEDVAVKLHYKDKCPIESHSECTELQKDTVVDHSLDLFEKKLTEKTERVMKTLGFFI